MAFSPLDARRAEFLAERRRRVTALFPAYEDLRAALLAIGGLEVVLPRYDEMSDPERARQHRETREIIGRGRTWPGELARSQPMERSNCHINVAVLYRRGSGAIVTGFALSGDGLWREHSWLVERAGQRDEALVETTVARLLYHGYVLADEESTTFVRAELGPDPDGDLAPGGRDR